MMTRFIEELGTCPATKPFNAFLVKTRPEGSTELPTHVAVIDGKAVLFDLWIDGNSAQDMQSQIKGVNNQTPSLFTTIATPQVTSIQSITLNPALDKAPPPHVFRHTLGVLGV